MRTRLNHVDIIVSNLHGGEQLTVTIDGDEYKYSIPMRMRVQPALEGLADKIAFDTRSHGKYRSGSIIDGLRVWAVDGRDVSVTCESKTLHLEIERGMK